MNIILTEQQLLNNVFLTEERLSSLILEGKDPVELLKYKFKNIPENMIETLVSIDPSKKKSMAQWVCKQWNDEQDYITRCLNNGKLSKLFQYAKDHSDVQLKDIPSVEKGIKMYVGESDDENEDTSDSVLSKSSAPTTFVKNLEMDVDSDLANDFDIVFKDDDWVIAVPHTYEAACKLGEGMKWCTANAFGRGKEFYNEYLSKGGQYYVNFDLSEGQQGVINKLEYPFTRYQFHFESNQFMDSHDDPVSFDDIDLPESAREFYEEEGYDLSEYGLSDEEKLERYEELRWRDAIRLTECSDLVLMQAWDEDWEFDENGTDYYIFDDNDERDPITWEVEFHKSNDVIQFKSEDEDVLVLKTSSGEMAILYKGGTSNYRDWEVYVADVYNKYTESCVIAINNDDNELFFTNGGSYSSIKLASNQSYDSVFINDGIRDDSLFAEAVTSEGFHTLVEVSPDEEMIIRLDVPQNGKYYETDENFHIHAKYRTYSVNWDEEDNENNQENFQLVKKLDDNRVLIQLDDETYNIYDNQQRKCIVPQNFNRLLLNNQYGYGISLNGRSFVISYDGQQIGESYYTVAPLIRNIPKFIVGQQALQDGTPMGIDIIDFEKQSVTARCGAINYSFGLGGENNTVMKIVMQDGQRGLIDYATGQIVLKDYEDYTCVPNRSSEYFCAKEFGDKESYSLFDKNNFTKIAQHVKFIHAPYSMNAPLIVGFNEQGYNLLDSKTNKFIFPQNYKQISISESLENEQIYTLLSHDDKLFFYNAKAKCFIINPNGIQHYDDWDCSYIGIIIKLNGYRFYFSLPNGIPEKYIDNGYSHKLDRQTTDPQILRLLGDIVGKDYTSDSVQENIRREFNETLKKLWKTW